MCCTKTKTTKQHRVPGGFSLENDVSLGFCKIWDLLFPFTEVFSVWTKKSINLCLITLFFSFLFSFWPNLVHVLPSCWEFLLKDPMSTLEVSRTFNVFSVKGEIESSIHRFGTTLNHEKTLLPPFWQVVVMRKYEWKCDFSAITGEEFYEDNSVGVILTNRPQ